MGRKRAFDPELALAAALDVFWRKGFDGASVTDLTRAMGITRPSLYAAFGDKEGLFRRAFAKYQATSLVFFEEALAAPDVRRAIELMLYGAADAQTDAARPSGCLATRGLLAASDAADPIRDAILAVGRARMTAMRDRFHAARAAGDLPPEADPQALAAFLTTVMQGMAVMAASGASRRTLHDVVRVALAAWPGGASAPEAEESLLRNGRAPAGDRAHRRG